MDRICLFLRALAAAVSISGSRLFAQAATARSATKKEVTSFAGHGPRGATPE